jgi:hypothetical protein
MEIYRPRDGGPSRIAGHPRFADFVMAAGLPHAARGLELPEGTDDTERAHKIEQAATDLMIAIWPKFQGGTLPDRTRLEDATLWLRDALNPSPLQDPNWLPPGLQTEQ